VVKQWVIHPDALLHALECYKLRVLRRSRRRRRGIAEGEEKEEEERSGRTSQV
jgi:hypothetical protein